MDIKNYMTSKFPPLKRLRERLRKYRLDLWLLQGKEKHSGHELTILYAGQERNKNYIAYIAFGDDNRETYLGKAWTWNVAGVAHAHPAVSLLVTETEEGYFNRFGGPNDFYIPCWVNGEIEFPRYAELAKKSENLKSDIRKVRKQGYQYEITRDHDKFDLFYHAMYRPYIIHAHGNRASFMSYEAMMKQSDITELLLIKQGDDYIAGENLLFEDKGVRAWSLGVKDGNHDYVRDGALGALYYYKINYLTSRGYDRYNAGASRAFLKDGVLQYKKKWGLKLIGARPGGFWLRIPRKSESSTAFLLNNPFIHRKGGCLHGLIFLGSGTEVGMELVDRLRKKHDIPGLRNLELV